MTKIEYGIIEDVNLYIEDHSCLVLNIGCKIGSGGYVSFGNVSLAHRDEPLVRKNHKEGDPTNYCGYFITQVLRVFDAYSFKEMKNKPCRLIIDDNLCVGIMNYLDDNKYFIPKNDWPEENGFIDPSNYITK